MHDEDDLLGRASGLITDSYHTQGWLKIGVLSAHKFDTTTHRDATAGGNKNISRQDFP
jgi:hypothetical protein